MRTRFVPLLVLLIAGYACNGPISDWPSTSGSDDEGPRAGATDPRDSGTQGPGGETAGTGSTGGLDAGAAGGAPRDAASEEDSDSSECRQDAGVHDAALDGGIGADGSAGDAGSPLRPAPPVDAAADASGDAMSLSVPADADAGDAAAPAPCL